MYTPEVGITLKDLQKDVDFLKLRYSLDEKGKAEGRLILRYVLYPLLYCKRKLLNVTLLFFRNEAASTVYSTDFLQKMLQEEGGSLFDSRMASLGHTLQGGIPSPIDRVRAVRLSLKCMSFPERHHEALRLQPELRRNAPRESSAVITIQSSKVLLTPEIGRAHV